MKGLFILCGPAILTLTALWATYRFGKRPRARTARRIWDDFGGECGNDAEYCRWTGEPATAGKCYCQQIAWRHAAIAHGRMPDGQS